MKLFGRTPWTRQPQIRNPLAVGKVVAAFNFGCGRVDLAAPSAVFTPVGATYGTGPFGVGHKTAASQYLSRSASISLAAGADYTAIFVISGVGFVGGNPGVWRASSSFNIFQSTTGLPWIRSNGADVLKPASGRALVAGGNYVIGFRVRSSKDAAFACNGDIWHTATHSTATSAETFTDIGYQNASTEALTGVYCAGFIIQQALSDADFAAATGNPWRFFKPLSKKAYFAPAASGNPALTGQAAVAAQGTLTPVIDAVLSGNASAAGQGVLSATLLLPLTGQATSAEQGNVAPVITVALTGLGATAGTGTLSVANQDVTVALTGVAMSVGQGALLAESATALTGQRADVAQGTVLPQIDKTLTGQAVALAQGSVLPQTSVALLGQGVSVGQGAMVAPGDLTVALMGVGVTVGQGALTASITPDPGNGKSGVNRMWLIEYYTKEFAKKAPIAVPEEIVGVAAKRNALNRAKALRAKQIEALAAKAESDLEVLAQGVEDVRAAQQFTYNLIHQAQRQPEPEIDFMRVADSYRKRMKQEDDDLMLFAMVI